MQLSYTIKLHFPYDIIDLSSGCEANAISFVLLPNNKLHVESSIGTPQYKLSFNRSYSKINNFSLMKSLNLPSLMDDKLQNLAHNIMEMKQMTIYSINSMLTKFSMHWYLCPSFLLQFLLIPFVYSLQLSGLLYCNHIICSITQSVVPVSCRYSSVSFGTERRT